MPISLSPRSCKILSGFTFMMALAALPYLAAAQDASADTSSNISTGSPPSTDNFGQNPQLPEEHSESGFGSRNGGTRGNAASPWDRTVADAYQMGIRSARFGGGTPEDLESLFEMASKMSGDLSKDVGSNSAMGKALSVLPKLNQIERNGLKLPVSSSHGMFQFGYHDQFGLNGNAMGGGIGRGSAQATYSTSGLKDDMLHFSASAMFGGMGAGMGSGMGGSSLSGGAFSSSGGANGMFSMGGMNGVGLGSGSGSFSTGGMHGGGMGFGGPEGGGMHGAGGHGKGGAENGPAVSLKLTFK